MDFVGELDAGRRRADDEHAARIELIGVAILHRRQRRDRRRHGRGERRNGRDVAGPGGEHERPAMPIALVG